MRERGVTAAAMEVSSHALALGRVGGVFYDVALFTNLSQDHLDFHRDLDDYFAAKARLFTPELSRVGVVNIDDPYGRRAAPHGQGPDDHLLRATATRRPTGGPSTCGWAPTAAPSAWSGPGGVEADAQVSLPGPFNVANALGAIVALVEAGVPLQTAVHGVGDADRGAGPDGAGADEGEDFQAVVDYSHKPGAVESVLRSLRPVTDGHG